MWLEFSLVANVFLLAALSVWFRQKFRQYFNKLRPWPIAKVLPETFDPMLRFGILGPDRETVIQFVASHRVPSSISDLETWILCNLAKKTNRIFEFGTCTGKTTWLLALNAPQARITTLTLRPEDMGQVRNAAGDDPEASIWAKQESCFTHFYYQGTPEEKRIDQLFGDSKQFDEKPFLASCDLIFVDGSHTRSYIESDSKKALAMVKPGGVVAWHDYRGPMRAKDVFTVLNKLARGIPLHHIEGTAMVVYRAPQQVLPNDA
jgi:predicted O-methyltransferase YrrM